MSRSYLKRPFTSLLLGLLVSAPLACSQSQGQTIGGSASVATTAPAEPVTPEPEVPSLADMPADAREANLAQALASLLPNQHLRQLPMDDTLSTEAFKAYLETLDGGKVLFLASHVEQLGNYRERMDDQMKSGDLVLARKGAKLLVDRRQVVAALVADILTKPFDFTKKESLETDVDKRSYLTSEAELRERWRKILKLQALERISRMGEIRKALLEAKAKGKAPTEDEVNLGPGETPESVAAIDKALAKYPEKFEDREKKVREELASTFAGRFKRLSTLSPLDPAERFINAITSVYDPHTRYLAPADKENFDIQMTGSLEGIGAVLSEDDHYIRVREVVPGGASWRQGDLEAGDLIMNVAQKGKEAVDVADMPIDKVVQMIRGKKGTVVTLTVKKPDDSVKVISITRDVVSVEAAYARGAVLKPTKGPAVGYVYLPSFYGPADDSSGDQRNATGDVADILEALNKQKVGKVVLDLRGNGGGYLEHARDITALFIPEGPVVQTRRSDGDKQVLRDDDKKVAFNGELVVMVDRFSASASEILAGALQDYERGVIVGTGPTHGKGTVQMLVDLNRFKTAPVNGSLGVLKLTIQEYFRVTGDSTQWRGVVPDVTLPDPAAHVESGERFLDHSIPWSRTDGLAFDRWTHSWDTKSLAASSKQRVVADPQLKTVAARTGFLKQRRERTLVPLERSAFEAQEKADKAKLESLDPKIDDSAERFVVTLVGKTKPQGEVSKRLAEWQKSLARDPWLDEALHVLDDMK